MRVTENGNDFRLGFCESECWKGRGGWVEVGFVSGV